MRLSKLFGRVFVTTVLLYLFFTITSTVVGYSTTEHFLDFQIGFALAITFFLILHVGFKRKEFKDELSDVVRHYSKNYNLNNNRRV